MVSFGAGQHLRILIDVAIQPLEAFGHLVEILAGVEDEGLLVEIAADVRWPAVDRHRAVQESLNQFFRDVALGSAVLERNGEFVPGQERSRFRARVRPPMLFIT